MIYWGCLIMSRLEDTLRRIVKVLGKVGLDYAVIGAFAVATYGRPRATVDVDVAVAVRDDGKLRELTKTLRRSEFELPNPNPNIKDRMFAFTDSRRAVEGEIWLHPDGIEWDAETIRRCRKSRFGLGRPHFEAYILSPEDLIVNSLARSDRSEQDETDVISILQNLSKELDNSYLETRATRAGVKEVLQAIRSTL